jgi:predicted NBD/HSP70 family sugar kinase
MLQGTNLQYANSFNIRIVIETIRLYGPVSRGAVARKTQLTAQTVTNITKKLLAGNLIVEGDRVQEGRGAPSILLKLNKDAAFSIGLDLDKDHLTGVLIDLDGNIRQRISEPLKFPRSEEAIEHMEDFVSQLISLEGVPTDMIWGVGVGLPGPMLISEGSVLKSMVNPQYLPGWDNVPVVEILEKRLNLPVYLENNASAAAIGERWYGAGKHINNFFYIYIGAGLGGGLFINGQLHSGATGNAGELGYAPIFQNGVEKNSELKPHLGEYFNLALLNDRLEKEGVTIQTVEDLERLFKEDNDTVVNWYHTGAEKLVPLLLSIEYLIDPEVIFIGGRLPDSILTTILEKIESKLPELRIYKKPRGPEIRRSTAGIDAGALGVATLPLYATFAPIPKFVMDQQTDKIRNFTSSKD